VIDTDCIHPPRGVERRAKLGAGHSESINADYIKYYIYNIYIYIYIYIYIDTIIYIYNISI
jgi:hypothetical protein